MMNLWIPAVLKIYEALDGNMRLVGGCVRDYLLNRKPSDIDVATPIKPREVMDRLKQKGIEAWPITLRLGVIAAQVENQTFEITTLRRDIYTEKGKEQIRFITDYAADSDRRDFTINAMFLDRKNIVYDYHGGQADLLTKQIRFIGDPEVRMREDPLRAMRYVRFWAQFGGKQPDGDIVSLLPRFRTGLDCVSAHRRCKEFFKIMMCDRAVDAVKIIIKTGLVDCFMKRSNIEGFQNLITCNPDADVIERLAILSGGTITNIWPLASVEREKFEGFLMKKK